MNAFDLNRHQKTGVGCGGGERSRGIKEGFSKIEDEVDGSDLHSQLADGSD